MGQCCAGAGQSPINLTEAAWHLNSSAGSRSLFHTYNRYYEPITLRNDGRVLVGGLEERVTAGGFALGAHFPADIDAEYRLWKFEIHVPSEHTFLGRRVDLELQLFHRLKGASEADDDKPNHTAVVSFGYERSLQPSPVLDALRQGGLPIKEGGESTVNEPPGYVDIARAFRPIAVAGGSGAASPAAPGTPRPATFWQYTGSLTTPPCRAGVQWFVRSAPLPVDLEALKEYQAAVRGGVSAEWASDGGNARELQPACGVPLTSWSAQGGFEDQDMEDEESNEAAFQRAEVENTENSRAFASALSGTKVESTVESQKRLDYEACASLLERSEAALQSGERQMEAECNGAAATESYYNGTGTPQAGALNAVQRNQCESTTRMVEGLRSQIAVQRRNCWGLKPASAP